VSHAARIERRNATLALIYHALEFGLATIGILWAIFQILQLRKQPLVECKPPSR
jgi:hypothetical protein